MIVSLPPFLQQLQPVPVGFQPAPDLPSQTACPHMDLSFHNHLNQFLVMCSSCHFCLPGWTWFIQRTSQSSYANQHKITGSRQYEVHQQIYSQLFPTSTPPKGCDTFPSKLWLTWALISIRGCVSNCHRNSQSVQLRKPTEGSVLPPTLQPGVSVVQAGAYWSHFLSWYHVHPKEYPGRRMSGTGNDGVVTDLDST